MANSSTVSAGDTATALQYNNLRKDVLDTSTGHLHDGTNGRLHTEFTVTPSGATTADAALNIDNTLNTKSGLKIYSDCGATAASPLVNLFVDNVAFDQYVISIANHGVLSSIRIYNTGVATGNYCIDAVNEGGSGGLKIVQITASATYPVAKFHQDASDGAIEVLELQQDDVDDSFVNFVGTAGSGNSIDTRNTSGATTDHILIELNGTPAWIPCSTNAPS